MTGLAEGLPPASLLPLSYPVLRLVSAAGCAGCFASAELTVGEALATYSGTVVRERLAGSALRTGGLPGIFGEIAAPGFNLSVVMA